MAQSERHGPTSNEALVRRSQTTDQRNFTEYVKGDIRQFANLQFDNVYFANEESYLLINHASSVWDLDYFTAAPIMELQTSAARRNQSVIALSGAAILGPSEEFIPDFSRSIHFFDSGQVQHKVFSPGGSHNIIFPKLKELTISGGYLEYCLCEAIRDSITGVLQGTKTKDLARRQVTFNLVPSAIYTEGFGSKVGQRSVHDSPLPLSFFLSIWNNEDLMEFLNKSVFTDSKIGFCRHQNTRSLGRYVPLRSEASRSTTKILVYREDVLIGTIGHGPLRVNLKVPASLLPPTASIVRKTDY